MRKNKKITVEQLAIMVKKGFDEVYERMERGFKEVYQRFEK